MQFLLVTLLTPISLRTRWDELLTDKAERYTAILLNISAKRVKSPSSEFSVVPTRRDNCSLSTDSHGSYQGDVSRPRDYWVNAHSAALSLFPSDRFYAGSGMPPAGPSPQTFPLTSLLTSHVAHSPSFSVLIQLGVFGW